MRLHRLTRFAGVSGTGLLLDLLLYTALCEAGMRPGWANAISAATAVSLVFVVSLRHVFSAEPVGVHRLFARYAVWQVAAITAASWAVDGLTVLLDGRYLAGKALVVPVTFLANYGFMHWLLERRAPQIARGG